MTDSHNSDATVASAIEAANSLEETMESLCTQIDTLKSTAHRQKFLIRLLTASLVIDLLLSVGFGWVALRADNAADKANKAAASAAANFVSQQQSCDDINRSRARQQELWGLVLTAVEPRIPEEVAAVRPQVARIFAPQVCP